jgi:hypothetical protein
LAENLLQSRGKKKNLGKRAGFSLMNNVSLYLETSTKINSELKEAIKITLQVLHFKEGKK